MERRHYRKKWCAGLGKSGCAAFPEADDITCIILKDLCIVLYRVLLLAVKQTKMFSNASVSNTSPQTGRKDALIVLSSINDGK